MIIEQLANMRKQGALMVANRELSEKQKEKIEKEINYMFYKLYTERMSAEAAQEIAKATYENVKNEYELGKGHLSNDVDKLGEFFRNPQALVRMTKDTQEFIGDVLKTPREGIWK